MQQLAVVYLWRSPMGGTLPRKYTLPEESVFYSLYETVNREKFMNSNNAKKLTLSTVMGFHDRAGDEVPVFSICVMEERYFLAAALVKMRLPYSKWMQSAHSSLGQKINGLEGRVGPVIRRRPTTHTVPEEEALKRLMFAMDYAPVKVGLVKKPEKYKFSSYRYYGQGKRPKWMARITQPAWYKRLGKNNRERQDAYRKMARQYYKKGLLNDYIEALLKGCPIGPSKQKRRRTKLLAGLAKRRRLKEYAFTALDRIARYAFIPTFVHAMAAGDAVEALVGEVWDAVAGVP